MTGWSAADRLGESMADLYLGVDVGGTKSHALLADQDGRVVGFGEGGAGNYEVVGWEGLRQTLQDTVDQALDSANMASESLAREQVAGAGFGVAGYDWPGEEEPTRQAIEALGLRAPYGLVNDATIGLLAGAADGWGLVVVAGTSNNCRGRDLQGREGGMTGCGPVFGEYGGASELVAEAVKQIAYAWTQRGPATRLADLGLSPRIERPTYPGPRCSGASRARTAAERYSPQPRPMLLRHPPSGGGSPTISETA